MVTFRLSIAASTQQDKNMKKIGKKDALMMCLNEIFANPIEEDEFTINDLIKQSTANGNPLTKNQLGRKMHNLIKSKKATSRRLVVDGKWVLAYRMK